MLGTNIAPTAKAANRPGGILAKEKDDVSDLKKLMNQHQPESREGVTGFLFVPAFRRMTLACASHLAESGGRGSFSSWPIMGCFLMAFNYTVVKSTTAPFTVVK